jgi:hypothetical protein
LRIEPEAASLAKLLIPRAWSIKLLRWSGARHGKDSIDHSPGALDDVANVVWRTAL